MTVIASCSWLHPELEIPDVLHVDSLRMTRAEFVVGWPLEFKHSAAAVAWDGYSEGLDRKAGVDPAVGGRLGGDGSRPLPCPAPFVLGGEGSIRGPCGDPLCAADVTRELENPHTDALRGAQTLCRRDLGWSEDGRYSAHDGAVEAEPAGEEEDRRAKRRSIGGL